MNSSVFKFGHIHHCKWMGRKSAKNKTEWHTVDPVETPRYDLTFLTPQIKPDTCANSVDPDETAHYEPSHQDLHCLSFCFDF